MAEVELQEQTAELEQAAEEQTEVEPSQEAGEAAEPAEQSGSQEQPAEPGPPKEKKSLLLPCLTVLLILLGLGEAVFWGLYGLSSYQNARALKLYEERQQAMAEEREAQGITGGSAYGPRLKVENGVVTWQREDELPEWNGQDIDGTAVALDKGEKRMSTLSVPKIPYTLAQMETEQPEGEQPPEDLSDPEETPTSA